MPVTKKVHRYSHNMTAPVYLAVMSALAGMTGELSRSSTLSFETLKMARSQAAAGMGYAQYRKALETATWNDGLSKESRLIFKEVATDPKAVMMTPMPGSLPFLEHLRTLARSSKIKPAKLAFETTNAAELYFWLSRRAELRRLSCKDMPERIYNEVYGAAATAQFRAQIGLQFTQAAAELKNVLGDKPPFRLAMELTGGGSRITMTIKPDESFVGDDPTPSAPSLFEEGPAEEAAQIETNPEPQPQSVPAPTTAKKSLASLRQAMGLSAPPASAPAPSAPVKTAVLAPAPAPAAKVQSAAPAVEPVEQPVASADTTPASSVPQQKAEVGGTVAPAEAVSAPASYPVPELPAPDEEAPKLTLEEARKILREPVLPDQMYVTSRAGREYRLLRLIGATPENEEGLRLLRADDLVCIGYTDIAKMTPRHCLKSLLATKVICWSENVLPCKCEAKRLFKTVAWENDFLVVRTDPALAPFFEKLGRHVTLERLSKTVGIGDGRKRIEPARAECASIDAALMLMDRYGDKADAAKPVSERMPWQKFASELCSIDITADIEKQLADLRPEIVRIINEKGTSLPWTIAVDELVHVPPVFEVRVSLEPRAAVVSEADAARISAATASTIQKSLIRAEKASGRLRPMTAIQGKRRSPFCVENATAAKQAEPTAKPPEPDVKTAPTPVPANAEQQKPVDVKPVEAKAVEVKPVETKPEAAAAVKPAVETKHADAAKPIAEPAPAVQAKPVEPKPVPVAENVVVTPKAEAPGKPAPVSVQTVACEPKTPAASQSRIPEIKEAVMVEENSSAAPVVTGKGNPIHYWLKNDAVVMINYRGMRVPARFADIFRTIRPESVVEALVNRNADLSSPDAFWDAVVAVDDELNKAGQ